MQNPEPQRCWDPRGQTWTSALCWKWFQKENNTGYGTAGPNIGSKRGGLEERGTRSQLSWLPSDHGTSVNQKHRAENHSKNLATSFQLGKTKALHVMDLSQLPSWTWAHLEREKVQN